MRTACTGIRTSKTSTRAEECSGLASALLRIEANFADRLPGSVLRNKANSSLVGPASAVLAKRSQFCGQAVGLHFTERSQSSLIGPVLQFLAKRSQCCGQTVGLAFTEEANPGLTGRASAVFAKWRSFRAGRGDNWRFCETKPIEFDSKCRLSKIFAAARMIAMNSDEIPSPIIVSSFRRWSARPILLIPLLSHGQAIPDGWRSQKVAITRHWVW